MLALSIPALQDRKERIVRLLADLGDMRPGSLSCLCGKPGCQ